jgi:hypothetical protein
MSENLLLALNLWTWAMLALTLAVKIWAALR